MCAPTTYRVRKRPADPGTYALILRPSEGEQQEVDFILHRRDILEEVRRLQGMGETLRLLQEMREELAGLLVEREAERDSERDRRAGFSTTFVIHGAFGLVVFGIGWMMMKMWSSPGG